MTASDTSPASKPRGPERADAAGAERLEGSVERVTYHSDETGFCVLRVKARGHRDLVTIVGNLPAITAGEWVQAEGRWTVNREHGRQFTSAQLKTSPPDSLEGIEKFLGSGLIKGIGPVYAAKLVARFGREIFDVIENHSAALEEVDGIGHTRRVLIKQGWNDTQAIRSIMAFLLSHGVSTTRAFRIYKNYGERAIETVRADPYCLARDIRGIGFKTADQIAASLGVEKTSDLRARAGVEHVLNELTDEGHCAWPRPDLIEKTSALLEIPVEIVTPAVDHGLSQERLVQEQVAGHDDPLIYLSHLHQAEVGLVRHLQALCAGQHPCPPIDADKAIAWCEQQIGLELAPAQRDAMRQAVTAKVMVITGGPGVGKTTLVNALMKVMAAKKLQIVLCAPTGRAAKRMAETTGRPAKTIHRLLAYDPGEGRFRHDREHPLQGDVFIVDESSMLDVPLAYHLVRAIPTHAAVIFVGDVDQLPSVGPGTVLRDVIESDVVPVVRLNQVFRQAAASQIVLNAHRVNLGQMPAMESAEAGSDFYFVEAEEPERVLDLIVKMITRNIPERFKVDPLTEIQVLTPMHRGSLGAQSLNAALQAALNPGAEGVERFGYVYRVRDRVMQTENDYDKDVFNGDMGQIVRVDRDEGQVLVRFDGRDVAYDLQELDELAPSYAITIHKSQGSEYPCVLVPVHTQHYIMLQRNLLYTAITRGRRLVVLVGTKKAVAIAVKQAAARTRLTTLRARLRTAFGC